jgi:ribosome-binding factor A
MSHRVERVADAIREVIAQLLLRGIKDPRIGMATITGVRLTPDLRHARVYFSVIGDEASRAKTLAGLRSAAGFIRNQIGKKLSLRVAPEVIFELDPTYAQAERVSQLLKDSLPEPPPSDVDDE